MECQNCELKQRQFYCETCLGQQSVFPCAMMPSLVSHAVDHSSLLSRRLQIQHAAADRDAHIASAQNSLSTVVEPARLRRAEFKSREERVQEIWDGVNALRSANDQRE